jgi:hypothetical protein
MFMPAHISSATSDFQMKAFPLKGIPETDWDRLERVAEDELRNLAAAQGSSAGPGNREGGRKMGATLNIHHDTGLLVVLGPPSFLEAVDSFVTAWHANQGSLSPIQQLQRKNAKPTGEQ